MDKPLTNEEQTGLRVLGEMLGDDFAGQIERRCADDAVGVAMTRNALQSTFAGVWGRPGLDRRSRSLVTLGVLIAAGALDELAKHFEIALRHGISAAELEEVVMQAQPYVGFAAAGPAMQLLSKILAGRKQD